MTKNEEKIIMEAVTMILNHIRPNGHLSQFSFSERKRLKNIKKKLEAIADDEWNDE